MAGRDKSTDSLTDRPIRALSAENRTKANAARGRNVVDDSPEHARGKRIRSILGDLQVLGRNADGFIMVATEEDGVPCFFSVPPGFLRGK